MCKLTKLHSKFYSCAPTVSLKSSPDRWRSLGHTRPQSTMLGIKQGCVEMPSLALFVFVCGKDLGSTQNPTAHAQVVVNLFGFSNAGRLCESAPPKRRLLLWDPVALMSIPSLTLCGRKIFAFISEYWLLGAKGESYSSCSSSFLRQ